MKEFKNLKIIGVDHGYGNIKTAGTVTKNGVTAYETEPIFSGNILEYGGMYYRIGDCHKEFIPDKAADEDYYLLTLMAVARELNLYSIREADVHLAAGLPLTWIRRQREEFRSYLLRNPEVTYRFNKKDYLPREFPVNNLTFSYANDIMSPSDRFVPTDKDNVFISFKWTTVDHMMYYERYNLLYDKEWENGLRVNFQMKREKDRPTGALFYQPLDGQGGPSTDPANYIPYIETAEFGFGIKFQPGATWINTKQRRLSTNLDSPIYSLNHTVGIKGLMGGDYNYNLTEASIYKRFWLRSWGKMDVMLKGGIQWNKVPYPLLIMPPANLSYIMEDYTFNLIDNMEFLNDRYASLMFSWDLNGKILNRIPLIRRLKWREYIGCNVLWGTLTDKNNPFLAENANDGELFYFPGNFQSDGTFRYNSRVMDRQRPYVELVAGIHNIFKLIHVEYVHRMNYLRPGTQKWGIRFMFRVTFRPLFPP